MKHPAFINVLLSHKIRRYSIPFLGTFSRGIFPMVSYVSPCFPIYPPVFLYFAMFCNALPCFPMFSSASPFIPMFSNVFPCFLMFSLAFLYFSLHPPFFLCFQMFSPVFLCFIPLFFYVHVSQITTQVVETSITTNTNSPHFHPDDHTQPTYVYHVTMLWLKNGIKYCCS